MYGLRVMHSLLQFLTIYTLLPCGIEHGCTRIRNDTDVLTASCEALLCLFARSERPIGPMTLIFILSARAQS